MTGGSNNYYNYTDSELPNHGAWFLGDKLCHLLQFPSVKVRKFKEKYVIWPHAISSEVLCLRN